MSDEDDVAGCGAVIIVALYCVFIGWMFKVVVPPFLYVTAILVSLAVPSVYIHTLWRRFGRYQDSMQFEDDGPVGTGLPWWADDDNEAFDLEFEREPRAVPEDQKWRNVSLFSAVGLVVFMYFDFLWIAIKYGRRFLDHPWAQQIHQVLGGIVRDWSPNAFLVETWQGWLPSWALWQDAITPNLEVAILCSAASKVVLVVPFVMLCRGLKSNIRDEGPPTTSEGVSYEGEPAHVGYFHAQAMVDLKAVVHRIVVTLSGIIVWAGQGIITISNGPQAIFMWPLSLSALVALAAPTVIGLVATLFFLIAYSVATGTIWLCARWISFVLSSVESAVIKVRAGYAKCPHATCHEIVPLPVYLCPGCSVEHRELVPGRYGVFARECQCGESLPTLFWFGKSALACQCPYCKKPMREELFADNVHIPIYGGPSSGKTMYLMSSTYSLVQNEVPSIEAELIEESAQNRYQDRWRPDFEEGRVREKTASPYPDAFLLSMRRDSGLPMSVYLYDPAGEAMEDQAAMNTHGYLQYTEGLAFLIDPMSLPSFVERHQDKLDAVQAATTSRGDPEDQLNRLMSELEASGTVEHDVKSDMHIAIVFSKCDLAWVAEELGIEPRQATPLGKDWDGLGLEDSLLIRAWMAENEPRLLHLLDTRFNKVRFFGVSALGHAPEPGKSFEPKQVLPPLAWLLSTRTAFSHPTLGLIWGKGLEVAAVAAVLGLFVGLPAWGAFYVSTILSG